jgi:hypothetical protein
LEVAVGRFSKAELQDALEHYSSTVDEIAKTGEWSQFADLFTEDVHYVEHAYGIFDNREDVRRWIVDVMAPFPHMRFPHEWVAFDEENDAIVVGIRNVLDHPTEPGVEFWFPNVTRIVYAGDGLFSAEEDTYNPARDAARVIGEWIQAGGQMLCEPKVPMKHVWMAPAPA